MPLSMKAAAGGGTAAIPASVIKEKTSDGQLVTRILLTDQNTTGAGVTYSVEGESGIITYMNIASLTSNNTTYQLTVDGKVIARELTTPIPETSRRIVQLDDDSADAVSAGLEYKTGFSLFVQSISGTSITVGFSYLELN